MAPGYFIRNSVHLFLVAFDSWNSEQGCFDSEGTEVCIVDGHFCFDVANSVVFCERILVRVY